MSAPSCPGAEPLPWARAKSDVASSTPRNVEPNYAMSESCFQVFGSPLYGAGLGDITLVVPFSLPPALFLPRRRPKLSLSYFPPKTSNTLKTRGFLQLDHANSSWRYSLSNVFLSNQFIMKFHVILVRISRT